MSTNDDIIRILNDMKGQSKVDNDALRKDVNDKLCILTEKIDTVKNDALEKEKKNDEKMKGILDRLNSIEKNMYKNKNKCEQNKLERQKQQERTEAFKEAVGLVDIPDTSETRVKTWSELVDESRQADDEKKEKEKTMKMKHWSKNFFVKEKGSKNKDDEKIEEKKKTDHEKEEEVRRRVVEEKRVDELKLSDEPLHNEEDWSWDDSDLEWDGTVEKTEANKKRKIDRYRKRKLLQTKVATKAKHMIGLGPIRRASVSYFFEITSDFEEAKKMAIDEFLCEYLQLNEDERKFFIIVETAIAKNDEDLIYVTFQDFDSVKEIRSRIAEIQNEEINTRNFIPPQFWERYKFLNKYCAEERNKDSNLKTLIRFNDNDIEVLFKNRKKDEQYFNIPLKEIEDEVGKMPKFDHSVQWVRRQDRPPKNPPKKVKEVVCPPSLRGSRLEKQLSSSSSSSSGPSLPPKRKKISHQSSSNMETDENIEVLSDKSL